MKNKESIEAINTTIHFTEVSDSAFGSFPEKAVINGAGSTVLGGPSSLEGCFSASF